MRGERRPRLRYEVRLTRRERRCLDAVVRAGTRSARKMKRAQILLAAARGIADREIAAAVGVSESTIVRVRRRFSAEGLDAALSERKRVGGKRKLSVQEEALLVATACSSAPRGHARWTLVLLANKLVRLTRHESISTETIRRRLHENDLKPWQARMWCVPHVDREFLERMDDVITQYLTPSSLRWPVVCFDETPIQLLGDVRVPVVALPGRRWRYDYEYQRMGTANVFMMIDARRGWRRAKVTRYRAKSDFAWCMRDLVDKHYPRARQVRVVLDNLSTHSPRALLETFGHVEASRILARLEFHFTPKHASWLNMAEIEIGVMKKQCLARRISDIKQLRREVSAWERERNEARARIRWMFGLERARECFGTSAEIAEREIAAA